MRCFVPLNTINVQVRSSPLSTPGEIFMASLLDGDWNRFFIRLLLPPIRGFFYFRNLQSGARLGDRCFHRMMRQIKESRNKHLLHSPFVRASRSDGFLSSLCPMQYIRVHPQSARIYNPNNLAVAPYSRDCFVSEETDYAYWKFQISGEQSLERSL